MTFPVASFLLLFFQRPAHVIYFDSIHDAQTKAKRDLIEIIQKADIDVDLDPIDKRLIQSVVSFRNRVAREVMVPRGDVYALDVNTSIKEAARLLDVEGYSRIPVYRSHVDHIVGLLMYKDVVHKFMEYEQRGNDPAVLNVTIETIIKEVLYTPETKKISHLLQEFRVKQVHLAVVVDEYGGTEGIITIEDILEEIVGEIADEYDIEEQLYKLQSDGSWILDARMNILDIETELGIRIPQEGDFDTIGGYIFHRTGSIPSKGFAIHLEDCEIRVLDSDERSVTRVKLIPLKKGE